MRLFPKRTIDSGDPQMWQFWRWMDINGPSGHDNGQHEELYLRRLYVLRTPWFGVMLHWIKREDWDRDAQHNHPWTFYRLILRGGYTETLSWAYSDTEISTPIEVSHRAASFGKFPDQAYHRIVSVKPHTVTLVLNGPKTRNWGFFVPGTGFVPWAQYITPGTDTNGAR